MRDVPYIFAMYHTIISSDWQARTCRMYNMVHKLQFRYDVTRQAGILVTLNSDFSLNAASRMRAKFSEAGRSAGGKLGFFEHPLT